MAETTESKTPQTWAELARQEWFTGIPQLVEPKDMTVAQSAAFEVTRQRVAERSTKLERIGFFKKPGERGDEWDEGEATLLLAEIVEYSDLYFRTLAPSEDTWDEWVKGRTLFNLYVTFSQLLFFYADALGKSSDSKTPSASAE
ncbi:hypothetical protein [Bifidobacterium sp. UTBIF-68]|uniref:hypothetical protein n=1 Tax=Bifidobacterium sp. UTBIF-68 TaxID=1465262 RepID=UPI00112B8BEF|nr:hypothetical protein [Bifidobacterium sp. UTBIF-68]